MNKVYSVNIKFENSALTIDLNNKQLDHLLQCYKSKNNNLIEFEVDERIGTSTYKKKYIFKTHNITSINYFDICYPELED